MGRHSTASRRRQAELRVGYCSRAADVGLSGGLQFEMRRGEMMIYNDDPKTMEKSRLHQTELGAAVEPKTFG